MRPDGVRRSTPPSPRPPHLTKPSSALRRIRRRYNPTTRIQAPLEQHEYSGVGASHKPGAVQFDLLGCVYHHQGVIDMTDVSSRWATTPKRGVSPRNWSTSREGNCRDGGLAEEKAHVTVRAPARHQSEGSCSFARLGGGDRGGIAAFLGACNSFRLGPAPTGGDPFKRLGNAQQGGGEVREVYEC